ncbi:MAG: tRNA (cytidine(34)-2'-O)-methyltransferase [Phycisphaerae bacterium]
MSEVNPPPLPTTILACLPAGLNLKIALVEPEIPQNTGNIARLCAVIGAELHLARPLGFFLTQKHLRRAGMDYLEQITLVEHNDVHALMTAIGSERFHLTSAFGQQTYWQASYQTGDWILFGKESAGLPHWLLQQYPQHSLRIPMRPEARGLNVATTVGIVAYEAVRQITNMQKTGA